MWEGPTWPWSLTMDKYVILCSCVESKVPPRIQQLAGSIPAIEHLFISSYLLLQGSSIILLWIMTRFSHPVFQLLILVLPTLVWMSLGGTQNSSSMTLPISLNVTVTWMGNGIALQGWPGMPCLPSAFLRTTVAPMPQSGWMAAILKNQMALSKGRPVQLSMETAASGIQLLKSRHVREVITSTI